MTADKTLLKCNHCTKEFKYDSERRRHEQSHFPQFQCKVCSKNFSFISALRRHEKQHERTSTVTCNECGREFRDDTLLKRHINYAHAGSHTCPKCDTIFYSEAALRTHMKSHKSVAERRYQCSFEECTKKFNFAHHLKHHELTHTNSKQHYCKICGKGFIQSHHLKAHLRTHTGDSSLYCTFPDCNKKFATDYAKKRHVTKYHIKTDSGISSDSNSAYDASSTPNVAKEEPIFNDYNMSPRADLISKLDYDIHSSAFASSEDTVEDIAEDLSTSNAYTDNTLNIIKDDVDIEISDCQLALGRCIMSDEGEKCVCIEINHMKHYDMATDVTESVNMNKVNDCQIGECCGGSCGVRNEKTTPKDDMPEIEYKTDGTVKIKEFVDINLPKFNIDQKYDKVTNYTKFIPFNSCKAVLGNCIVSGNGTIGEGCLCAKMIMDDQVTAQEIDDITPRPK